MQKRGITLPGGYEQLAMDKWADLRDRAGLVPITEVYPNATTEELIELCRKERRVNLLLNVIATTIRVLG